MRSSVQIPRTPVKLGKAQHACTPGAPIGRGEAGIGASLEACRPPSLLCPGELTNSKEILPQTKVSTDTEVIPCPFTCATACMSVHFTHVHKHKLEEGRGGRRVTTSWIENRCRSLVRNHNSAGCKSLPLRAMNFPGSFWCLPEALAGFANGVSLTSGSDTNACHLVPTTHSWGRELFPIQTSHRS